MVYYEHFCTEHIGMILTIATIITLVLIWCKKADKKHGLSSPCVAKTLAPDSQAGHAGTPSDGSSAGRSRGALAPSLKLARILAVVLFLAELIQDILAYNEGFPLKSILPFHLCNMGIFIHLLSSFTRGKVQQFFSEISLVLIMPGAIGAILFPDWNYQPFWKWLSLMIFFTHMLLTLIPLIHLVGGRIHVKFTHFWYSILFMLIVTPPVYWLDVTLDADYLFLRIPVSGSPLEWTYNLFGEKLYVLGLFCLMVCVLAFEYCLIIGLRTIRNHIRSK